MNTRTATCAALLALAFLTAGCSNDNTTDQPSSAQSTTAAATPTVDQAAARQACVDAVAAIPVDENGEVPSEPIPDECAELSEGDYLDAYMDGIQQSNQDGRDALQDLIDEASENATP